MCIRDRSLHRAESDQLRQTPRQPAQRRPDEKDDDGDLDDLLASVKVSELSVQRRDYSLREEICGDYPREMGESSHFADNCWEGCCDDCRIERSEQQDEQQSADSDSHLARR